MNNILLPNKDNYIFVDFDDTIIYTSYANFLAYKRAVHEILNIDIIPTQYAWISEKSNKYHFHPHCSGLQNSSKIKLDDINTKIYTPCKKCSSKMID